MCWTAPPIRVRDSAISEPAAVAACCASLEARSISRFPPTMVSAARCSSLNCPAWLVTRCVTSSRFPATSASSTPNVPIREASSDTSRPSSRGPLSFMREIMPPAARHKSVPRPTNNGLTQCNSPSAIVLFNGPAATASMAALHKQARAAQGLRELSLDTHRLAPGNVLKVQRGACQDLQAPLQHTSRSPYARLVLVKAIRRTVVTHPHVHAVRIRATVAVVQQHEVDVRSPLEGSPEPRRHLVRNRQPVHIPHRQPV